jgi:hypothetical protein
LIGTGTNVAHRWGEDGLDGLNRWEVYELYQATGRFISAVNWKNWNFATSEPWENRVTGNFQLYENGTIPFKIARGDGDQVMLLFQGAQNTVPITVAGLQNGNGYQLRVFDYLTGNIVNTRTNLAVTNGSLTQTIDTTALDRRVAVVLIENTSAASATPSPNPSTLPSLTMNMTRHQARLAWVGVQEYRSVRPLTILIQPSMSVFRQIT